MESPCIRWAGRESHTLAAPCRQYLQPAPAAKKHSALPLLMILTEVAYIATYLTSMGLNSWSFESLKVNPMAGGPAGTLRTLGAVRYDEIVYRHQWWRLVTAPFVCSGRSTSRGFDQRLLVFGLRSYSFCSMS